MKAPSKGALVALAAAALTTTAAIWWAGRPLPDERVSGVLWGVAQGSNNIRPWIDPTSIVPRRAGGDRR
jgi:hypothetical protein